MVVIVGHRGACGYAPENTLLSFQTAIDLGCERTELDVRLSKDNELIVIHDDTVDRTTDGHGRVNNLSLKQIKKLKSQGQSIPTLQEVIDLCKGKIELQIELKELNTASPVNKLIIENDIVDDVVVSSFDILLLKEMRILNSEVRLCYLFDEPQQEMWRDADRIPLDIIGPKSISVRKGIIDRAHNMGLEVYSFWTNEQAIGNRMIEEGIDAIGTDFPKMFLQLHRT